MFDVLFIDGSELGSGLAAGSVLNQELCAGLLVLLEDMNDAFNCDNYNRLVNDQKYELVDHNTSPHRSYAIFRKAKPGDQLGNAPYWASTVAK